MIKKILRDIFEFSEMTKNKDFQFDAASIEDSFNILEKALKTAKVAFLNELEVRMSIGEISDMLADWYEEESEEEDILDEDMQEDYAEEEADYASDAADDKYMQEDDGEQETDCTPDVTDSEYIQDDEANQEDEVIYDVADAEDMQEDDTSQEADCPSDEVDAEEEQDKSANYYAVLRGAAIGVVEGWERCKKQINDYPDAIYKGFASKKDAINFIADSYEGSQENIDLYVVGYNATDVLGWAFTAYDGRKLLDAKSGCEELQNFGSRRGKTDKAVMTAIINAVKWAEENGMEKFTLCYDKKKACDYAVNKEMEIPDAAPHIKEYVDFIRGRLGKITFQRVKANCGIVGNKQAYDLAKEATKKARRTAPADVSINLLDMDEPNMESND